MPRADFDPSRASPLGHAWLAEGARLVIVPVVLFGSGFFTADFLVSGQYTWPRSSRIVGLTLTILVLSYEFVYKEQRARRPCAAWSCATGLLARTIHERAVLLHTG